MDAYEIAQFIDMNEKEVDAIFTMLQEHPDASDMEIATTLHYEKTLALKNQL